MELNLDENLTPEVQQAKLRLGIVGNAPALTAAVARALRVAPIDLSVLVVGESGSGKEFFPKIIHSNSPRKHSTYIAVNCGAIPEGTIDSELFGHEKGAFTGAVASRKGYFEEADGGTIFLDEVAELPLTTQARLLRVLETGEFIRVGSSNVQKSNVRIVAATNVDMAKAVAEGRFREDLYYRLSTVQINVPPLRERGNDVLLLARKFAGDFAERYHTHPVTFSDGARRALLRYRWPGNVRQLKNVVDQLSLFGAGNDITAEDVVAYLPAASSSVATVGDSFSHHDYDHEREALFGMLMSLQREIASLRERLDSYERGGKPGKPDDTAPIARALVPYTPAIEPEIFPDEPREESAATPAPTLEQTERETIRRALERHDGRRKDAARELQISERTLYRKIKDYGLE